MKYRVLIADGMGRWAPGEVGTLIEAAEDLPKYNVTLEFQGQVFVDLSPLFRGMAKRVYSFRANEVEAITAHVSDNAPGGAPR